MTGDLTDEILNLLRSMGADCSGIGSLPVQGTQKELPVAVVWGMALAPAIVEKLSSGPSDEYEAELVRLNDRLAGQGRRVADFLQKNGFHAVPVAPTTGNIDQKTLSADFPHKTAATRAGLGWVGKCALLVTREYGSAIRICSVLTDAPLRCRMPVERSYCGECNACREVCPAGAPSGKDWYPGIERDEFWNSRACYEQCIKAVEERGHTHSMCGMCIPACPWTQKYLRRESGEKNIS